MTDPSPIYVINTTQGWTFPGGRVFHSGFPYTSDLTVREVTSDVVRAPPRFLRPFSETACYSSRPTLGYREFSSKDLWS